MTAETLVPSRIVQPLRKESISFWPIFSSSVMSATISLAFSSLVCARTPDTLMPDTAVTLINKASIAEIIFLFFMLTYHSFPYLWMPYLHENAADR